MNDDAVAAPVHELLRQLPSIASLLEHEEVGRWLAEHPRPLVTDCLRQAVEDLRARIVADGGGGRCGAHHVTPSSVLMLASERLRTRTSPHLRRAINATGIVLHTGLGRSVPPAGVVDSVCEDLKGYVTLAVDRETGSRSDRELRVEHILNELTGAEAALVVNNNAAATMLVLAALAQRGRSGAGADGATGQVIVSRGQLIEIGGSFRLPEVMAQSGARLVEVGSTNRTHLRDYEDAIGENTAAIMRVHPSNFRIVGFTREVPLAELVSLCRRRGIVMIDDLGAGALIGLEQFGLPHEPTAGESIAAGADIVLFSADKLIGAGQGGVILGRRELIGRIRRHPLMRAVRADKTCLMLLERTLMLFRDPDRLRREHPLYRVLSTPRRELRRRAGALSRAIGERAPGVQREVREASGYLGSGSLPMHALATFVVRLKAPGKTAADLAQRLRMDEACVFSRLEEGRVALDVLTLEQGQIGDVAEAIARVCAPVNPA